jgi:hypothetical protein
MIYLIIQVNAPYLYNLPLGPYWRLSMSNIKTPSNVHNCIFTLAALELDNALAALRTTLTDDKVDLEDALYWLDRASVANVVIQNLASKAI